MKLRYPLLLITLFISCSINLFAQNNAATEEVIIKEIPASKNATFEKNSPVVYSFNLKNTYKTKQEGTLSYLVTTPHGQFVSKNSIPVSLAAASASVVKLEMPAQSTGFYKVSFMLNVSDYDDTVRRVFGVDIHHIQSDNPRPADFDQFWLNTKAELAKIQPNYKVTERPDLSGGNDQVYLVEMKSLDNVTVRAWLTLPKDRASYEKLPVYIMLPGYGAELGPFHNVPHFACLTINVRGLGNSRDVINPTREQYITYNIQDKNKYIYRGAIMDCVRLLDFASTRPELDASSIYVTGGSMGGYLALALAGLDKRVTLCSADNPTFSDLRWMVGLNQFPMFDIEKYAKQKDLKMEALLKNLDYFDLKNFTPGIQCKTMIGMGLLDVYAPPTTELVAYNKIDSNKTLYIYPNLGHEVDARLGNIRGKWVYDNFNIYEKLIAQNPINPEGQGESKKLANAEEVAIEEQPVNKDAIFKVNNVVGYNVEVRNTYGTQQKGKLSYRVTTTDGKLLTRDSVAIQLDPKSSKKIRFEIPAQKIGFYKVNFMINVTDYDDTIRRVFGVSPDQIRSKTKAPADFDDFWKNTRAELAKISPNYKVTEKPELEKQNTSVYLVEMQSLDNVTIRGYLTIRKDRRANQKFPVWVLLPGYGLGGLQPVFGATEIAVLALNVRGIGNSRDVVKPTRTGYLTTNIEDKNKYIYRGAIMDCIRGIDFICSRPDLDSKSIIVAGGSAGGYLSIATASLDKRVTLCSSNNPVYADYRSLSHDAWPMSDIKDYADDNSIDFDSVLNNLDYFDLKNLAPDLKCKTLLGISLLDNLAPPYNVYTMINSIPNKNKMFIYPNLGHEVPASLFSYLSMWMIDNFGLY